MEPLLTADLSKTIVVCVPFAGAGVSFFHPWRELAGRTLEILPLQLPGRERRIDEEPLRDARAATESLLTDLLDVVTAPARVAVFGHSLGAVLAYELAHRLTGLPGFDVRHLFVSGSPQPSVQRSRRITGLPDDDFLPGVAEFAGFDHEALDDPEVRELVLPTLRADVEMHENYLPSTTEPLPVPITSLRGVEDSLVSADDAAGWSKATDRTFTYHEVPGGHMYLVDAAPRVVQLFTSTLD